MAVRHVDEGLELQLIDYLLMAREATSVEITEDAKGLEPLDKTLNMISMRILKLDVLCLKLGASVRIEKTPSGEMQWVPSKLTIWHNEMPRPKTPQEYMAIIWSRLGRKELATHLLLQIEEWVSYLVGAI